jgi:hypothetical protein
MGSTLPFAANGWFDPILLDAPPVRELDEDVVIVLEEMAELVPEVIKASFQSPIVSGK